MTEETEAQEGHEETQESNATEERAREMGWRPKEEWEGDTSNWMEAEKFVERQDRLKERADGIAKAEIHRLNSQLAELKDTISDFRDHHTKVEQRAYERALKDLKVKQRAAVEDGNAEAFDQVEREIADLQKDVEKPAEKKVGVNPDFNAWQSENTWYSGDPLEDPDFVEMTDFADKTANALHARHPELTGRAFYDKVGEVVKRRFAEKFENPRRRQVAAVEGAGDTTTRRKGKTYADLPAEAKSACDKFVKAGLFKTRDEYVKEYEWE